jgi:diguanylate cyclase (GGDEF)-like protein
MEIRAKILIVDDEPVNILMLNNLLAGGYHIIAATNGEQALKRAVTALPDLILLDTQMPDMNGYEVYEYLSKNEMTRTIPVVFVSASVNETEEKKGLEMGAIDYITRPYRPAILQARIKNYLELKQQRDLLSYLSSVDMITGCANRRGFETFVNHEWQSAVRFGETISLLFIDIDHFDVYREKQGQVATHKCLRKIADILRNTIKRKTDLIAYYGDNRFACVLSRTSINGAVYVAKCLQESMQKRSIPHAYTHVRNHITLSIGIASINPFGQQTTLSHLLVATNKSLQQAKHQGGNQIVVFNDSRN